jgi:hypothetical protein
MKKLIFGLLLIASGAQAQQVMYLDQYGRVAGWSNTYGSQTVLQDRNGRVVGYANQFDNQTTYQNRNGKVVGYANRYGNQDTSSYDPLKDSPWLMYDPNQD